MACQFLEAARKDLPDLNASLEKGDFGPLKTWLNREVRGCCCCCCCCCCCFCCWFSH